MKHFSQWAVLISTGVLASTLSQPDSLDIPIRQLLKDQVGLSSSDTAVLWAISAAPWYLKPIAGLLADSVPFFHNSRRSYLVTGSLCAALGWIALSYVPHSTVWLISTLLLLNSGLVLMSSVVGALVVDGEKIERARGRLVALRGFFESVCTIAAGPLAGLLALHAFWLTSFAGAITALAILPAAVLALSSPEERRGSTIARLGSHVRQIATSKAVYVSAGFVFLVNMPQEFPTVSFYFARNTANFSVYEIGWIQSAEGVGAVCGSLLFAAIAPRLNLRPALLGSLIIIAVSLPFYRYYADYKAAVSLELFRGVALTFNFMCLLELCVWASPDGASATSFAIFMGALNLGSSTGDILAARLTDKWGVSFANLGLVFFGLMLAFALLTPLLPSDLFAARGQGAEKGA